MPDDTPATAPVPSVAAADLASSPPAGGEATAPAVIGVVPAQAVADVEATGRSRARGGGTSAGAVAGAGSPSSAPGRTAVMEAPPSAPAADPPADAPLWSFREPTTPAAEPPAATNANQVELPFMVPVAASPPQLRREPMFGPAGRDRPALLVPLLAALTLGGYALVWHHRTTRELEEFDPQLRVRPARSTLAVALPWVAGLLTTLAGATLVLASRLSLHLPFGLHASTLQAYLLLAGLAVVPYLVLLLPFSVVAVVMTLERLRCVEEHVGRTTDEQVRPVATVLLLAIPVLGGLLLLGVEQRRINAIWDDVAPAGRRRR